MTSVSAEDGIVLFQMSAHSGGDRFLADIGMTGTVDEASLMAASEFLFRLPNDLHRSIKIEDPIRGFHPFTTHESFIALLSKRLDRVLLVSGSSPRVHRHVATVHGNDGAGDPFRGVRRKEHRQPHDVFGLSRRPAGIPEESVLPMSDPLAYGPLNLG